MASPEVPGNSKGASAEKKSDHLLVAAIDFGTTFTGFAFSLSSEPNKINTSKWSGENVRTATEKAPTCVLFSPDKKFIAFGYEAEEKYKVMIEEEREKRKDQTDEKEYSAKQHYYFERFKMGLYQTKKLRLDTKLPDKHGKEMPAIDIFAAVINHLKNQIHAQLKTHFVGFQQGDILWVITIPAIWSDSAKQFMRKAALQAGLEGDVKLILEPEAASLYCNNQKLCKIRKLDESVDVETFPEGQKYIVADLGGGTADLSVHEILPDRNLKEIHRADGDAIGGIMVDAEFFVFLERIFGTKVIKRLRDDYADIVIDTQLEFETKKRNFSPDTSDMIRIKIPKGTLTDIIDELSEESLEKKIRRASEVYGRENLKIRADKLCIGKDFIKSFFTKATDGIVSFINKMREDDELGEINTLLMVGGFSESAYVQDVIKQKVPGVRIIVPVDPSLAVLKGAVTAGRNPKAITERIARFTYGFSAARKFIAGVHPEKLKTIQNGVEMCGSIFIKLITKGDILKVGDHFGRPMAYETSKDMSSIESLLKRYMPLVADVYRSEETDPKYSEEEYGCELIGLVLIPPPLTGWPAVSIIVQELVVGEAEFTVRAVNLNSKDVVEGQLDFLASVSKK